jgi:hypothetical protein
LVLSISLFIYTTPEQSPKRCTRQLRRDTPLLDENSGDNRDELSSSGGEYVEAEVEEV